MSKVPKAIKAGRGFKVIRAGRAFKDYRVLKETKAG